MLQWTQGCLHSFKSVFWVSSDKYPEVELLGLSLSLVIAFILKSILSGTSIATPACFLLQFSRNVFFPPFTFVQSVCIFLCEVSLPGSMCRGPIFTFIQLPYVSWLEHLIHLHVKNCWYVVVVTLLFTFFIFFPSYFKEVTLTFLTIWLWWL